MLIDEGVADPTDDQVIAKLQALQKEEDEAAKNAQRDDLKDIALQRLAGQPQVFNRWAAIGSIQN